MSKRKDRERFLLKKEANTEYVGFRGAGHSPSRKQDTPLEPVICIKCGRKRNVPASIAIDHTHDYICTACEDF